MVRKKKQTPTMNELAEELLINFLLIRVNKKLHIDVTCTIIFQHYKYAII